ncbi:HIRAN domain-containing protein [Butyrivibrio sp. YAB3001]|uniref:HIRAN domain-containing protein n=1 Tax=Butyrivibrio sp. YAB3001 TaxID=1520812 RepID=UPI0008F65FA2|nr:HIRAN domain-containing protein [Butyrivibrio sp. YAB3001]SFC69682.1 HIRAN domain-containing protein [Butyrivibrio sp. YAB3001]
MANELVEKKESAVAAIEGHELGDIIKPLIKEIHLFDSYIAGTTHLEDSSVLESIKVGDVLTLQREENKFDNNAILILNEDKKKLGYVPEKDNIVFARLMDAGKLLKAKITQINQKGSFKQISVGIYLVDF